MNRQQAKELLPIIQAFAEGKTIERKGILDNESKWCEVLLPTFNVAVSNYRIKPESKYRPFIDNKECWNEMLKHQPFGWVRTMNAESDLGGGVSYIGYTGFGSFRPVDGVGHADAAIGFLGCANPEIAQHLGKYFGMLITEAKYGDMVDFEII